MKLLNLACGNVRPPSTPEVEWRNVDYLLPVLGRHSPEWNNLRAEANYTEFDVTTGRLPFVDEYFDGVVCSHFIEHVDCQQAVKIMVDCKRVLKPGGVLLISVPDASYFRNVHDRDTVENAQELFGEPIHLPDGETAFFGYGLWNSWHKAILTEDSLWCYFVRAGFATNMVLRALHPEAGRAEANGVDPFYEMLAQLNRLPFSLVMFGVKE